MVFPNTSSFEMPFFQDIPYLGNEICAGIAEDIALRPSQSAANAILDEMGLRIACVINAVWQINFAIIAVIPTMVIVTLETVYNRASENNFLGAVAKANSFVLSSFGMSTLVSIAGVFMPQETFVQYKMQRFQVAITLSLFLETLLEPSEMARGCIGSLALIPAVNSAFNNLTIPGWREAISHHVFDNIQTCSKDEFTAYFHCFNTSSLGFWKLVGEVALTNMT